MIAIPRLTEKERTLICKNCHNSFIVKNARDVANRRFCSISCKPTYRTSLAILFWRHVDKTGPCWEWTAGLRPNGYGDFGSARRDGSSRNSLAHQFAYKLAFGPIPPGLEIDHLCRNRKCVRPSHLEAVTHRENTIRGTGCTAVNARKTHCHAGHPYNSIHTKYLKDGSRQCQICRRDNGRRRNNFKGNPHLVNGHTVRLDILITRKIPTTLSTRATRGVRVANASALEAESTKRK